MKTILGTEIPEEVKGIVYLCTFNQIENKFQLTVDREILCETAGLALCLYSEIPNPASQIAMGKTKEEFEEDLQKLHENMKDPVWLKQLSEQL